MKEPSDIISLFKQQYEALAGRVYSASSPAAAVTFIKDIFATSSVSKPVAAILPATLDDAITSFFNNSGIVPIPIDLHNQPLQHEIGKADVGLSACDFGIASTGTVVEVTTDDAHRLGSSLPRVHIAFLPAKEIVRTLEDSIPRLRRIYRDNPKSCNITFISGPSRTADIEMKLFLGVHGPQESHVIVCDWEL